MSSLRQIRANGTDDMAEPSTSAVSPSASCSRSRTPELASSLVQRAKDELASPSTPQLRQRHRPQHRRRASQPASSQAYTRAPPSPASDDGEWVSSTYEDSGASDDEDLHASVQAKRDSLDYVRVMADRQAAAGREIAQRANKRDS